MECNCCLFRGMEVCEFESGALSMSEVLADGLFDGLGDFFDAVMVEFSSLDVPFTIGEDSFETLVVPALVFSTSLPCRNGRGGRNGAEGPLFMMC